MEKVKEMENVWFASNIACKSRGAAQIGNCQRWMDYLSACYDSYEFVQRKGRSYVSVQKRGKKELFEFRTLTDNSKDYRNFIGYDSPESDSLNVVEWIIPKWIMDKKYSNPLGNTTASYLNHLIEESSSI